MHREEFFKLVRIKMEEQVSEEQKKSEKPTFEVSILIKKWQNNFFCRRHARVRGGNFFLVQPKDV